MTGSPGDETVMAAGDYYNAHSELQHDAAAFALPLLARAAAEVPLPDPGQPVSRRRLRRRAGPQLAGTDPHDPRHGPPPPAAARPDRRRPHRPARERLQRALHLAGRVARELPARRARGVRLRGRQVLLRDRSFPVPGHPGLHRQHGALAQRRALSACPATSGRRVPRGPPAPRSPRGPVRIGRPCSPAEPASCDREGS